MRILRDIHSPIYRVFDVDDLWFRDVGFASPLEAAAFGLRHQLASRFAIHDDAALDAIIASHLELVKTLRRYQSVLEKIGKREII